MMAAEPAEVAMVARTEGRECDVEVREGMRLSLQRDLRLLGCAEGMARREASLAP